MQVGIFDLTQNNKKCLKTQKKPKKLISILVIVFIFTYFAYVLTNHFSSIIISVCHAKVESVTMSAINDAVIEVMSQSLNYNDLVINEKDSNGDIALFETNSVLVNRLARDTAQKTQSNLQKSTGLSIDLPLGQLTGIAFFACIGPNIAIKICPYESVNCTFESEFEQAGINQTRHKIFLNVIANMQVILPTSNKTITTCAQVLICESLLVGKVPQIYFSSDKSASNLSILG